VSFPDPQDYRSGIRDIFEDIAGGHERVVAEFKRNSNTVTSTDGPWMVHTLVPDYDPVGRPKCNVAAL